MKLIAYVFCRSHVNSVATCRLC